MNIMRGKYAIYIPLLLLPVINMAAFKQSGLSWEMLLLVGASFGEEVFFRGFLLSGITKQYKVRMLRGILITSSLFALLHLANLYQGAPLRYTIIQVLCAGGMGGCFAVIAYRERSIIPCVIIHGLVNLTSSVVAVRDLTDAQTVVFAITAMLYGIYGIWLYQYDKRKVQQEKRYESIH